MEYENNYCLVLFEINQQDIKCFCEAETIHYKKINESILNTITFYLENGNQREVDFNEETLTFTLRLMKN